MKILFYTMFGVIGMLGVYFTASSMFGSYSLGSAPVLVAKLCLLVGALIGLGLLYLAYLVGEVEGRSGAGAALVFAAMVAFQVVQVAGMVASGFVKKFMD
ncbi:MAG: hypothetical protein NTW74_24850 [Acidobacteria bacterium]|nr:hypothetical protein [Acidobacteriota bacterium]